MTASVSLSVTPLSDNSIAFVNADAWNNYWNGISGTVTLEPVTVTLYTSATYDNSLQYQIINIDGNNINVCTNEMFQSLKAIVDALNVNYQSLRTSLKNAGMIDKAQ